VFYQAPCSTLHKFSPLNSQVHEAARQLQSPKYKQLLYRLAVLPIAIYGFSREPLPNTPWMPSRKCNGAPPFGSQAHFFIVVRWISDLLEHEVSVWSMQNWGVRKVCAGRHTHCLLINQNLMMRERRDEMMVHKGHIQHPSSKISHAHTAIISRLQAALSLCLQSVLV